MPGAHPSIRDPAALCGIVGLKPSYDLVSTEGIIPLSPSLDHAGPMTRSVEDAAIVLDAITNRNANYRSNLKLGVSNFVLGVPRNFFFEDLDSEVAAVVQQAIDELKPLVSEVREVDFPVNTDRALQSFESYDYHRKMVATSAELYDPETLRRIHRGVLAGDD